MSADGRRAGRSNLRPAVGLVGVGRMGSPMARHLAKAGHPLVLYNRTAEKANGLASALGCDVATDPADLARRCDLVIVTVGDERDAEDVCTGPRGLVGGLKPTSMVALMSTLGPETVRGLSARITTVGARTLDAPISGTPVTASEGRLVVLAGGEVEDVATAAPVLGAFARSVVHLGPLGTASTMKLILNSLVFGLSQSIAEGLVLAERCGIDADQAYQVFLQSGVSSAMMHHRRDLFVRPGAFEPVFQLVLAEKDLRLIEQLAASVDVDVPQAALNRSLVTEAVQAGLGDEDLAAMTHYLRSRKQPGE